MKQTIHTTLLGRRVTLTDIPRYSNPEPWMSKTSMVGFNATIVSVYLDKEDGQPSYDLEIDGFGQLDRNLSARMFDLTTEGTEREVRVVCHNKRCLNQFLPSEGERVPGFGFHCPVCRTVSWRTN